MSTVTNYSTQPQRLAMPAWYLVKEFAGIYGVKMNYGAVKKKLKRDMITRAYFDDAKLPPITQTITITYNNIGQPEEVSQIMCKDWIAIILKHVAIGYSNRKFYESLAYQIENVDKIQRELDLTHAELVQVNDIRNDFQHRAPRTYGLLARYYMDEKHRDCIVKRLGELIEIEYAEIVPLYIAKEEAMVAALFVNGVAN
tara:strand:+ start:282 stop:878 length:597 start_codon:yes stop_codon:yes gene_type:complete